MFTINRVKEKKRSIALLSKIIIEYKDGRHPMISNKVSSRDNDNVGRKNRGVVFFGAMALLLSTVVIISSFSDDDGFGVTIFKKPKRVIPQSSPYVGVWNLTKAYDGDNVVDLPKEYGPFLFHFEEEEDKGEDEDANRQLLRLYDSYSLKLSAKIGPSTLSAPVRVYPEPRRGDAIDVSVGDVSSTHNQESEEQMQLNMYFFVEL